MKYAVVECGGKQYKVVEGGTIQVDRMLIEDGEKIAIEFCTHGGRRRQGFCWETHCRGRQSSGHCSR